MFATPGRGQSAPAHLGNVGEAVEGEVQLEEQLEVFHLRRQLRDSVGAQHERDKTVALAQRRWEGGYVVVAEIDLLQLLQTGYCVWNLSH